MDAPRVARAARGAPGRVATAALACVLAVGSCNSGGARSAAAPSPSPTVTVASAWRFLVAPQGFLPHAMTWTGTKLWLGGERVSAGAHGAVVEVDPASGAMTDLAELTDVLHVRALVTTGPASWLGGDTPSGRGVVMRSLDGKRWIAERLPSGVTDVESITAVEETLWATARAGDAAVILSRTPTGWLQRARVARPGVVVRLRATAGEDRVVVAAGEMGRSPIVLRSADGGATFRRLAPPVAAGSLAAATLAEGRVMVAGYAGEREDTRRGLIAAWDGSAWMHLPIGETVSVAALAAGATEMFAIAATGAEDVVLIRSGTWRRERVGAGVIPATLEALIVVGSTVYVAGQSGLYRRDA